MSNDTHLPLRNALDEILQEYQTIDEQITALQELRFAHPHSIRPGVLTDFCEEDDGKTPEYDCFTFALDLVFSQERIAVREYAPRTIGPSQRAGIADALPGQSFLQYLQLPKQNSLQDCHDNDLVVYYDKFGKAQHAGKILGGMIISKWGMKGGLWQHGLWEVPNSYGRQVEFYAHRSRDHIRQLWLNYLCILAERVIGFCRLVSVICQNKGDNLKHEDFLRLAAQKAIAKQDSARGM